MLALSRVDYPDLCFYTSRGVVLTFAGRHGDKGMDLKDHQLKGNMQKRVQPPSRHWESTHVFSILLSLLSVPRRVRKGWWSLSQEQKKRRGVWAKVCFFDFPSVLVCV